MVRVETRTEERRSHPDLRRHRTPRHHYTGPERRRTGERRTNLRRSMLLATSLLVVLSAIDVATTNAIVQRGGYEANALADAFLARGWLPLVKLAACAALVIAVVRQRRVSAWMLPITWAAVGAYTMVVALNLSQL